MKPKFDVLPGTVAIIDKLVKKLRKDLESKVWVNSRKAMSVEEFYRQMCSIRIGLPRRTGNTTLALMLLDKYHKSIYIGATRVMAESALQEYTGRSKNGNRFFSANMVDISLIVDAPPKIIITDCLSYASKGAVEHMYCTFDANSPVYIHLGS
jgi:hypothetical protein